MFCRLCSLCSGLANNQMQKTGGLRPGSMLRFLPASDLERSKDQQLFTATSRVGPNNALHGSILFLRQVSVESC